MTAEYYLGNASYYKYVFIRGDGSEAESDYNEIMKIYNGFNEDTEFILLFYVDSSVFDSIDTKVFSTAFNVAANNNFILRSRMDFSSGTNSFVSFEDGKIS